MTQADLTELLEACRATPVIMIGSYVPASPQENANAAWARLGEKMAFDPMSVRPSGGDMKDFTAVPSETPAQKNAR